MTPRFPKFGYPYTIQQLKDNAIAESRYAVEKRYDKYTSLSAEAYALAIDVLQFTGQQTMEQSRVDAFIDYVGYVADLLPLPRNRVRLLRVEQQLEKIALPEGYQFPRWSLSYLIGELAAAKFLFAEAISNWEHAAPCHWNDIYWIASKPYQFNIIAPVSAINKKEWFAAIETNVENMEQSIARAIVPQWTKEAV